MQLISNSNENNHVWWNNNNAFNSRLLDAFSILIPEGERFLNQTISDWLSCTTTQTQQTQELKEQAKRFMHEEASHQRAHDLYNAKLAETAPQEVSHLTLRAVQEMKKISGMKLSTRIGLAAALEQLTAIFCKELLHKKSAWLSGPTTTQKRLWQWHAGEEINHHQIMHSILLSADVNRVERLFTFTAATYYLANDMLTALVQLYRADLGAKRVSRSKFFTQALCLAVKSAPSMLRMSGHWLRHAFGLLLLAY
jgi:uncharacterized protein